MCVCVCVCVCHISVHFITSMRLSVFICLRFCAMNVRVFQSRCVRACAYVGCAYVCVLVAFLFFCHIGVRMICIIIIRWASGMISDVRNSHTHVYDFARVFSIGMS